MTSNPINRMTRALALLVLAAIVSACASVPPASTLRSIPSGENISVVTAESDVETPDARTAGQNIASGAAGGAAGGAVMGAGAGFVGGFACGPFFVVCSPAAMVAGAAGGAIFGAAVGGISNGMLALPKEKAEALESVMAAAIEEAQESQLLAGQFELQSADRWTIAETAKTQIVLTIEEISIDQGKDDRLTVRIVNSMTVIYGAAELDTPERVFHSYVSGWHHVDHWLADDGVNFRSVVREGIENNVAEMIRDLTESSAGLSI